MSENFLGEPDELQEVFEALHFMLFAISVVFICVILAMLRFFFLFLPSVMTFSFRPPLDDMWLPFLMRRALLFKMCDNYLLLQVGGTRVHVSFSVSLSLFLSRSISLSFFLSLALAPSLSL
jgi:hypothetical protein